MHSMRLMLCAVLGLTVGCACQAGEPNQQAQQTKALAQKKPEDRVKRDVAPYKIAGKAYPAVNGSTSAEPLGRLIAIRRLGSDPAWFERSQPVMRMDPEGGLRAASLFAVAPLSSDKEGDRPNGPDVEAHKGRVELANAINRSVRHDGTHSAYMSLVLGGFQDTQWKVILHGRERNQHYRPSDLILVARKPSPDEIEAAKLMKVELDVRPVALDGFVFIVNKKNPVRKLTSQQIRAIYTGKLTNWRDVGGQAKDIRAYQRNRNSGSQVLMETVVMQGTPMINPRDLVTMGMMGPYNKLQTDTQGIGYSIYFYERFMTTTDFAQLLTVDGVMPSYETIRDRSYPFVTEVYVAVRKGTPAGSEAMKLFTWLLSEAGQAVVKESGYVPLPKK